MSLNMFRTLFPWVNNRKISHHKNNAVLLKMYSNSNIEQLSVCAFKLWHKDKSCQMWILFGTRQWPSNLGNAGYRTVGHTEKCVEFVDRQQAGRKFDTDDTTDWHPKLQNTHK